MILQLFGLLDILGGVMLLMSRYGNIGNLALYIGILIIIKAIFLFGGTVSLVDILGGSILIFGAAGVYHFLVWLMVFWFLQKGFFSFVS